MDWSSQQNEIDSMLATCRAKNYPLPHIYMSDWGYKRCFCDECGLDVLIRGYVRHWFMMHTPKGKKQKRNMPKLPRYHRPVADPDYVEMISPLVDPDEWRQRSKESIDRILKRHSAKL